MFRVRKNNKNISQFAGENNVVSRNPSGGFLDILQFIKEYYADPIVNHEGYNIVNTLTYALIAILVVYSIYRVFEKNKIRINREFVINTIPFVLFGSTARVITDSLDTGVMKPITPLHEFMINSHLYDYGFLTSSPGIYIVTAVLFFASLFIAHKTRNPKLCGTIGLALWLPHFIALLFMVKYLEFAIPVLVLAAIPFYLAYRYFKAGKPDRGNSTIGADILAGIVGAHALDGAATFFIIDFFGKLTGRGYFEQHVIPSFIGETFGTFFPFYLLKIAIAFGAAYFIANEKEASGQEKHFISLLLIIMGLAPGLRDLLRMVVGA